MQTGAEKEVETQGAQRIEHHLGVWRIDPQCDHDSQRQEMSETSGIHAPIEEMAHEREQGDYRHLGVVAGIGKGEEGWRGHIGDAAPDRRPATDSDSPQVEIHAASGQENREDVAPSDMALVGGKKIDQVRREILWADLVRLRETAHLLVPHGLRDLRQLLEKPLFPLVKVFADVRTVDHLLGKNELGEVGQTDQKEQDCRKPCRLPEMGGLAYRFL